MNYGFPQYETKADTFFRALGNVLSNRTLMTLLGVGTVAAAYVQAYGN